MFQCCLFGAPSDTNDFDRLMHAVRAGNVDTVMSLIDANVDINDIRRGCTPLMVAAESGHLEICQLLIASQANVNRCVTNSGTALMKAVSKGRSKIVKLLLSRSADMHLGTSSDTALSLSLENNKRHIRDILLPSSGCDSDILSPEIAQLSRLLIRQGDETKFRSFLCYIPQFVSQSLHSWLEYAVQSRAWIILEVLSEHGAKFACDNDDASSRLFDACKHGYVYQASALIKVIYNPDVRMIGEYPITTAAASGSCAIVNMLLRAKSSVNCQNTKGDTPLLIACNKNHVDMARLLIHADADLVKANYNGDCALALAAWEGHAKIVQLLLSSKCNPDTPPDKRGDVPLLNASWQGHSEIVSLLVKAKASVTTVNKLKDCALIIAARNGYRTIVSSLVSHKADVERCNTLGDTPLILAAAHGDLGIVKALVAAGAAVDRRGSDGVTAMSKASGSHGNADVVKYLIKNGGNVNARSVIGRTPLMSLFAYYGELQRKEEDIRRMAEMLVHAGADVCSKDQFQRSILHHAAVNNMDNQNKYVSAAKMLLSAGASAIINDQDNKGKTAVMLAIEKGSVDMIAMLVECKADLTISRSDGMTSLMVAVQHDQHTELLQIIIDEVACAQ